MKHYDFRIKQGDTQPVIQSVLTDGAGAIVNLTGIESVAFRMRAKDTATLAVNAAAAVVSAPAGSVRYAWLTADTATPGEYEADWLVTFAGGGTGTFPNGGYLRVLILPKLF